MFIINPKIGQWTTVCELRNMINHHTHRPANTCNHYMFVEHKSRKRREPCAAEKGSVAIGA